MMERRRAASLLVALAFALAAPSHAVAQKLAPEVRQRIGSLHVQVVVPQEAVIFATERSRYKPDIFRLMIGDSAQSLEHGAPWGFVREALDRLLDADFRAEAQAALPAAAADFPLPVKKLEVLAIAPTDAETAGIVAALQPEEAYLRILTHYALGSRSDFLTARSQAKLWTAGSAEVAYTGRIIVEGPSPRTGDDAAALRGYMRLAATETLLLVGMDMASKLPPGPPRHRFALGRGGHLFGELVARHRNRVIVRLSDTLISLDE